MMEFNLYFRRLLRKKILQTSDENLDRHECLLARRFQWERHGLNVNALYRHAGSIFSPFQEEYRLVHKLWITRRQFALEQGHFFQIPITVKNWKTYLGAYSRFWRAQVFCLLTLWWQRKRYTRTKHPVYWVLQLGGIAVLVGALLLLIYLGGKIF